jgi:hypothetical protein
MQNFRVLKQVVHREQLDFEWLINNSGKPTKSGPPTWEVGHETKKPTCKTSVCCNYNKQDTLECHAFLCMVMNLRTAKNKEFFELLCNFKVLKEDRVMRFC